MGTMVGRQMPKRSFQGGREKKREKVRDRQTVEVSIF